MKIHKKITTIITAAVLACVSIVSSFTAKAAAGDDLELEMSEIVKIIDYYFYSEEGKAELLDELRTYQGTQFWKFFVMYMPEEYQSETEYREELADVYIEAYKKLALAENSYELFSTSDGVYGTSGIIEVNGKSLTHFICDESGTSCSIHEDGLGEFKFQLIKIDDSTTKVEYTIKNIGDVATDFDITFCTATYGGGEFHVSRIDNGFILADDTDGISVGLDSTPSMIKFYDGEGVEYAWQGWLEVGESKTFSATYATTSPEFFEANFYHLADNYTTPTTVTFIDGNKKNSPPEQWSWDYNWGTTFHAWSTEPHGTKPVTDFSSKEYKNYYEVEVEGPISYSIIDGFSTNDSVTFNTDTEYPYSELNIMSFPKLTFISEGAIYGIDVKDVSEIAGEGYRLAGGFSMISVVGTEGDNSEAANADVVISLPLEFFKNKKDIKIIKGIPYLDETTTSGIKIDLTLWSAEVNYETGEILIDFDAEDTLALLGAYFYMIAYVPTADTPEDPEPEPFIPGVPNTGVFK